MLDGYVYFTLFNQACCFTNCEHYVTCRLKWLFAESTALFPSVYLRSEDMSEHANMQYITSRVEEAVRVAQVSPKRDPVYVYMWSKYQDANRFLSKVCSNIQTSFRKQW